MKAMIEEQIIEIMKSNVLLPGSCTLSEIFLGLQDRGVNIESTDFFDVIKDMLKRGEIHKSGPVYTLKGF